jgi:hypothetical protein
MAIPFNGENGKIDADFTFCHFPHCRSMPLRNSRLKRCGRSSAWQADSRPPRPRGCEGCRERPWCDPSGRHAAQRDPRDIPLRHRIRRPPLHSKYAALSCHVGNMDGILWLRIAVKLTEHHRQNFAESPRNRPEVLVVYRQEPMRDLRCGDQRLGGGRHHPSSTSSDTSRGTGGRSCYLRYSSLRSDSM